LVFPLVPASETFMRTARSFRNLEWGLIFVLFGLSCPSCTQVKAEFGTGYSWRFAVFSPSGPAVPPHACPPPFLCRATALREDFSASWSSIVSLNVSRRPQRLQCFSPSVPFPPWPVSRASLARSSFFYFPPSVRRGLECTFFWQPAGVLVFSCDRFFRLGVLLVFLTQINASGP